MGVARHGGCLLPSSLRRRVLHKNRWGDAVVVFSLMSGLEDGGEINRIRGHVTLFLAAGERGASNLVRTIELTPACNVT